MMSSCNVSTASLQHRVVAIMSMLLLLVLDTLHAETIMPTSQPTTRPTSNPTSNLLGFVNMSLKVRLQGCTSNDFNSAAVNAQTFAKTIANSAGNPQLDTSFVKNVLAFTESGNSAINVLKFSLTGTGLGLDEIAVFNSLNQKISNGQFNDRLRSAATSDGAPLLVNAKSLNLRVTRHHLLPKHRHLL